MEGLVWLAFIMGMLCGICEIVEGFWKASQNAPQKYDWPDLEYRKTVERLNAATQKERKSQ
jgi:hypothetical protein